MKSLTMIYPYYNNRRMLEKQYETWNSFRQGYKDQFEVVIVDDCSRIPAKDVPVPKGLDVKIFRVLVDMPWNWDGARNIGAFEATGQWLFMTDMDHVVPEPTLAMMLNPQLSKDRVFLFERRFTNGRLILEQHMNTYLMTQEAYWKIGGYDEDFSGFYGMKDTLFRGRVEREYKCEKLPGLLVWFSNDEIPDSSVTSLERNIDLELQHKITQWKVRHNRGVQTFKLPWERVL